MRIYLGESSAIKFIGENEKEFTRANFSPKPIVQSGDIVILDKLSAYNISKLLPTEWELIDSRVIEVESTQFLQYRIDELEEQINELEEVIAEFDLIDMPDEDRLNNILDGIKQGAIVFEALSEYDQQLYLRHIEQTKESEDDTTTSEDSEVPSINQEEALKPTLLPLEKFVDKDALADYALETFGLELNKRMTLENMYKSLCTALDINS